MSADLSAVQVGDELPALTITVNREQIARYAGAALDFNPIHVDDQAAQAIGMPGVIAHGMWTMGAALRIVTDWVGDPNRVASYSVRFSNPLPIPRGNDGTKVLVTAKVTAVADGLATIAIDALHDDTKLLGAAKAQVRID